MLSNSKREVFILTDSNIDLLSINSNSLSSNYLEKLLSYGFFNTILKATHFSKENFTLIDHILSNSDNTCIKSGVLVNDLSDHLLPFCQLNVKKNLEAKYLNPLVLSPTLIWIVFICVV